MGKHGIPEDSIAGRGLSEQELELEMNQRNLTDKASTYRPKDETLDEKRERKKAIKEERRVSDVVLITLLVKVTILIHAHTRG